MKPRVHGEGNIFAEVHRQLGAYRAMTDLDFLAGEVRSGFLRVGVADDGEDSVYSEYLTDFDKAEARTTAIFDYKHTMSDYIHRSLWPIRTGTALWYYSQMAKQLHARAFVVVAANGDLPLSFFEITEGRTEYKGDLLTDQPSDVKAFWRDTLNL